MIKENDELEGLLKEYQDYMDKYEYDESILWNEKSKKDLRNKKIWKIFRKIMLIENGYRCAWCKKRYKGKSSKRLNLHHMHNTEYDNLDRERFRLLCTKHHDMIHDHFNRYVSKIGKTEMDIETRRMYKIMLCWLGYTEDQLEE